MLIVGLVSFNKIAHVNFTYMSFLLNKLNSFDYCIVVFFLVQRLGLVLISMTISATAISFLLVVNDFDG